MDSSSWFIFILMIVFIIIAIFVIMYMIENKKYGSVNTNDFNAGDIVTIRSFEADSKPLGYIACTNSKYNDNSCLLTFQGDNASNWKLSTKMQQRPAIDLQESVIYGAGDRYFLQYQDGADIIGLTYYSDNPNKNKYISAIPSSKYTIEAGKYPLWTPFFSPAVAVGGTTQATGMGSVPTYNIAFKTTYSTVPFFQNVYNDAFGRLRPGIDTSSTSGEVFYTEPSLAVYKVPAGTYPNMDGSELEYLFLITTPL